MEHNTVIVVNNEFYSHVDNDKVITTKLLTNARIFNQTHALDFAKELIERRKVAYEVYNISLSKA